MKRIPKKVRQAAQAQTDKNATELVALQKGYAPKDDGELIASIRQEKLNDPRVGRMIKAGGAKTTKPVRKGQSATYDYALAQELGTEDMAPNPYFYPPYRINKRKYKARVTRAVKKAIRS